MLSRYAADDAVESPAATTISSVRISRAQAAKGKSCRRLQMPAFSSPTDVWLAGTTPGMMSQPLRGSARRSMIRSRHLRQHGPVMSPIA